LPTIGKFNLGATWYGNGAMILRLAKLATDINFHLLEHAFNNKSENKWPFWFSGVASMYAQELAVNHLVPETFITHKLDFPSDRDEDINNVYHIHCFHSPGLFNKFEFEHKYYDHINTSEWDIARTNHWALEMALRSNLNKPKTVIQLYPPQQIAKPNYKYLIEMKNNFFVTREESEEFSHINTDIKYHLDHVPQNVFRKDKYFWSYFSPQKGAKFIFFSRHGLATPCAINIFTGIKTGENKYIDVLRNGK
jgi:hypothetical protein